MPASLRYLGAQDGRGAAGSAGALRHALTGLPNRCPLMDWLEQAAEHATREGQTWPSLSRPTISKQVNDTLGHSAGDEPLRRGGPDTVRAVDTVARLGGDEFVVRLCRV